MANTKPILIAGSGQAPLPRITEAMIQSSQIRPLTVAQSYPTIRQTKQKTTKKLNKHHMLNQ